MAEIREYFTEIRKLVFGKRLNRAFHNRKEVLRMIYNGEIVFDRQLFLFSVEDHVDIEASGTNGKPLWSVIGFTSRKYDYSGENTFVNFTGADEVIDANTTSSARYGTYTIVQDITGFTLSGTWAQMGKEFQHYSFKRIESVEVNYEELPYIGTSSPYVAVTAILTMHYSSQETEDVTRTYISGVSVTSAQGNDGGTGSGAYINTSTGVVSIGGPSSNTSIPVFYVTSLGGTVNIPELTDDNLKSWSWSGSIGIMQTADQRVEYGTPTYTLSAWLGDDTLGATDTTIVVYATARKTSYYYYESDPDNILEEISDETLYVLLDENVSDSRRISGSGSTTFNVGINESTSSSRSFKVHVYHSDKSLYDKTFTVTQSVNSATEYWGAPSLNGNVVVEEILADGTGQPVFVPIIQKKYARAEGTTTDTLVETFTGSVEATSVGGTAVSNTGASFADGIISASSLGRTETTSTRKVYTITSVSVTGKDGKTYSFNLPSSVAVYQAKNNKYSTSQGYILEVSANPSSGIANTGGSSTISYSAREKFSIYFDADPTKTNEYSNVSATLSTSLGTLSSTSVTGSGTATLSFGENTAAARNATVTLAKGSTSKSCSVSQNSVSYVLTAGSDQECNATGATVYVTFTSSRNGKVWQPSFTANLSGAAVGTPTSSGFTYTVPVTVPANTSYDSRDIVVTATQTRYNTNATATVTITQAGVARPVVRTINAYGTWNAASNKVVDITAFLSNDSSSSVTFRSIRVELRRSKGTVAAESELVVTATYAGTVTVPADGSSSITISDITHTRDRSYNYWLAAYATQTTETTYNEIEEHMPEE